MLVYILELNFPYEGSMVEGIFLSLEGAMAKAQEKNKEKILWEKKEDSEYWHQIGSYDYFSIFKIEVEP